MNIDTSFLLQTLLPITRILLAITVIGFSYSAIAADVVTDDQIRRVAKIARATKTDITITKERVTVTVHGSGKKTVRKVRKSVNRIMKQRNYVPKRSYYSQDAPDFASAAPALDDEGSRPPPVLSSSGHRQPPTLNTHAPTSQPPVLDKIGGEDSEYY